VAKVVNDPSNGDGSEVSRVVREIGIGKIHAFAIVVVDPISLPPSLPPSDEGGDQSVYLDSLVTERAPEPENEK
jgi:hypothetical protein